MSTQANLWKCSWKLIVNCGGGVDFRQKTTASTCHHWHMQTVSVMFVTKSPTQATNIQTTSYIRPTIHWRINKRDTSHLHWTADWETIVDATARTADVGVLSTFVEENTTTGSTDVGGMIFLLMGVFLRSVLCISQASGTSKNLALLRQWILDKDV